MVSFLVFVVVSISLLIIAVNFEAIFATIEDFPYEILSDKEKRWYKYFSQHPKLCRRLKLAVNIYFVLISLICICGFVYHWVYDALHLV